MILENPTNSTVYSLAWPMAMNAILLQATLIVDTILVGALGEQALAAMGIATSIGGLILGVLFALSNGTQILVAQAFGADNKLALKSSFWSGSIIAVVIATTGTLLILTQHKAIVGFLAKAPEVATLASSYLTIFTIVIFGVALCQNMSVFFNATGRPKLPFFSKMIELPFNAVISYLLIYGKAGFPEYGLAGAAIGSAAAVTFRTLFLIACLAYFKYQYLLSSGWLHDNIVDSVKQHLENALPIAGTFISMSMAMSVCLMIYSQLSTHEFAALTILYLWIRIGGMMITAWAQATGILVGQLLGQNRFEMLDSFVGRSWRVALYLAVLVALIYSAIPFLFSIIYPELQQQTIDVVWTLLPLLILLPFTKASNTICGNVLRAGGQAAYAFKVHVSTQWLFTVPASLLCVLVLDVSVFWVFSLVLFEELLKAIPFHLRMRSGTWKNRLIQS